MLDEKQDKLKIRVESAAGTSSVEVNEDEGRDTVRISPPDGFGEKLSSRYEVLEVIGEGGMGTVYKVRHVFTNRLEALKLMNSGVKSSVAPARFQQEARAACAFSHPNAVAVYDFDLLPDGRPYMAMEYVDGINLADWLDKHGPMDYKLVQDICAQVGKALAAAHERGVIHRDVKPSNIMIKGDQPGKVSAKVVDFGIAKVVTTSGGTDVSLTATGQVFGSPQHMSPEQCMGTEVDARSDIYSLGCVMYQLLTGRPAHTGDNPLAIIYSRLNDHPLSFKDVAPNLVIPAEMERIVFKALERDPNERYQNMQELLADLEADLGAERPPEGDMQQANEAKKSLKPVQDSGQNPGQNPANKYVSLAVRTIVSVASVVFVLGCAYYLWWTANQMQNLADTAQHVGQARSHKGTHAQRQVLVGVADSPIDKARKQMDSLDLEADAVNPELSASARQEKIEEIRREYDKALSVIHSLRLGTEEEAAALQRYGKKLCQMRQFDEAESKLKAALRVYKDLNDAAGVGETYLQMAVTKNWQGQHDAAIPLSRKAVEVEDKIDPQGNYAMYANFELGVSCFNSSSRDSKQLVEAENAFGRVVTFAGIDRGSDHPYIAYQYLGRIAEREGKHELACEYFEKALEGFEKHQNKETMKEHLGLMVQLYSQDGSDKAKLYQKKLDDLLGSDPSLRQRP